MESYCYENVNVSGKGFYNLDPTTTYTTKLLKSDHQAKIEFLKATTSFKKRPVSLSFSKVSGVFRDTESVKLKLGTRNSIVCRFRKTEEAARFERAALSLRRAQKVSGNFPDELPTEKPFTKKQACYGSSALETKKRLKFSQDSGASNSNSYSKSLFVKSGTATDPLAPCYVGFMHDENDEDEPIVVPSRKRDRSHIVHQASLSITSLKVVHPPVPKAKSRETRGNALSLLRCVGHHPVIQDNDSDEVGSTATPESLPRKIGSSSVLTYLSPKSEDVNRAENYEKSEVRHSRGGLRNTGNFCYVNSVVQLLCRQQTFINELKKGSEGALVKISLVSEAEKENKAPRENSALTTGSLINMLIRTAKYFEKNEVVPLEQSLDASDLRKLLCKSSASKQFLSSGQQDAHEFLQYLLEGLEKEVGQERVNQWFGSKLSFNCRCCSCRQETVREEVCTNLTLVLPENEDSNTNQSTKVCELLNNFSKADRVNLKCSSCDSRKLGKKSRIGSEAIITQTVERAPLLLCLHLNRFTAAGSIVVKDRRHVEVEENVVFGQESYSLKGVVKHNGSSVYAGHYCCYVRSLDNQWSVASDETVEAVGKDKQLNELVDRDWYLALYIRKPIGIAKVK